MSAILRKKCCCPKYGACCYGEYDENCIVTTSDGCQQLEGIYQGDGTDCDPNPCLVPQACCDPITGDCSMQLVDDCLAMGHVPQGAGTDCDPNPCPQPQTGACCEPDFICVDNRTQAECTAAGGWWGGAGSVCPLPNCEPVGACCLADESCLEDQTESDCIAAGGVSWHNGMACGEVDCTLGCGDCTDCPTSLMVDFDCLIRWYCDNPPGQELIFTFPEPVSIEKQSTPNVCWWHGEHWRCVPVAFCGSPFEFIVLHTDVDLAYSAVPDEWTLSITLNTRRSHSDPNHPCCFDTPGCDDGSVVCGAHWIFKMPCTDVCGRGTYAFDDANWTAFCNVPNWANNQLPEFDGTFASVS